MADRGYTEQYVDYSDGRENPPTLTIMVGVSGSGKSTLAKQWVAKGYGKVLRFNRDSLRLMLIPGVSWGDGGKNIEDFVRRYEQEGVKTALRSGRDAIVDDTNCVTRTRYGWEEIAKDGRAKFRVVTMTTPLEECIARDAKRTGTEHVGEIVIRRQAKDLSGGVVPKQYEVDVPNRTMLDREALRTGEFTLRLKDAPIVIVDVDGTLANHIGVRGPFEENKVLLDGVWDKVADWVRELYATHNIVIMSGRHATCCDDTVDWLNSHKIPFDFILMRSANDNRSDAEVKPELLSELLTTLPKERVAFVIDDRPKVVRAWKKLGLTVRVVYAGEEVEFITAHTASCRQNPKITGYRRCVCGALENF